MINSNPPHTIVIGAGFAGLSAAITLAFEGHKVTVIEKNEQAGGRARVFKKNGFTFDMGPSWYWMPDVMEDFFSQFGKSTEDYFELKRLDPSYQVIYAKNDVFPVPADYGKLQNAMEEIEQGSASRLDSFLAEAEYKYEVGINEFVHKPGLSLSEFMSVKVLKAAAKLDLLQSFAKHIRRYFSSPKLLRLLEFPVLFLGAVPKKIPALYSMMNYADIKLGTWYPIGGFGKLAEAMHALAIEQGVEFKLGTAVKAIEVSDKKADFVVTDNERIAADFIIGAGDYHHIDQHLLPKSFRNYSESYWEKRVMAPSCLLYYVGVNKKLPRLLHHNLFFENDFEQHAKAIYEKPAWPENPLYYVCCPSKTDATVAPEGMENLFLLIPVAPGLKDTEEVRERYFDELIGRLEDFCGEKFKENIITKTTYAYTDFVKDYNAFKGNAYGLANTLGQTAILKPSIKNKKLQNMYYTGQLTVPGPGVPPAIISGQVVADYILKHQK
ncbi:MAG: phytoene desaturase family protein [Pedobacter sp.]|uniref:phytoene desaturase family protein n=1 Tax=Pedobacter sp. TaxID=1411316 RepID=UPI00280760DF|nr:phytoene desaturase family protein [Pedobacter sp.]MDQ8003239.1 phytoene desaturase family protein [Pedobacter sp.]